MNNKLLAYKKKLEIEKTTAENEIPKQIRIRKR